ncbi:MAG: NTP transferase domain-containing protein [Dehalococcoidia bacterium]|nr:NTP transferase domain-containing protein [Dehalococcoidia bacterium]
MSVAGILLAAAAIERDGEPLALQAWDDDETLAEWQARQLLEAGAAAVEVVVGFEADRIIPVLARDDVEPIVHAAWLDDVAGAVRIGAAAVPRGTDAAIIVDLATPRDAAACALVLEAHITGGAAITRARDAGVPGWPVVVDAAVLAELRNATDEAGGLEAVLRRHAGQTRFVG